MRSKTWVFISEDSVDYPDYAVLVTTSVADGTFEKGILICGSGQGMCITAPPIKSPRCVLLWPGILKLRHWPLQHNNANILCLPGRFLNDKQIDEIIQAMAVNPL